MAKFTAGVDLNIRLPSGEEIIGVAGTTHRISDAIVTEFERDVAPGIPGFTWITQDEMSSPAFGPISGTSLSVSGAASASSILISDVSAYIPGAGQMYVSFPTTSATNNGVIRVFGLSQAPSSAYTGFLVNKVGDIAAEAVIGWMGDVSAVGVAFGPGDTERDTLLYRAGVGALTMKAATPRFDFYSTSGTPYASLRFLDSTGAARGIIDYATSTTDDIRMGTYTGAAGAETFTENIRLLNGGGTRFTGRTSLYSYISPTTLSANTDNWNPTGLATASVIRMSTDSTIRTLTGIVAGENGDVLYLHNLNTSTSVTLAHASTSTATNQFSCPGATNYTLGARSTVMLWYDASYAKWLVMAP